jgi:hypothetical protein
MSAVGLGQTLWPALPAGKARVSSKVADIYMLCHDRKPAVKDDSDNGKL